MTGLLRRMKNKQKSLRVKLEPQHSKKTESNDGSTGDAAVHKGPIQLTVPRNDVHVDHSTAQLLEHLDDGALARGNASRQAHQEHLPRRERRQAEKELGSTEHLAHSPISCSTRLGNPVVKRHAGLVSSGHKG